MNCGIYEIFCMENEKTYIGRSVNLKIRAQRHFNSLRINKHINKHLQNSFNKYGESSFIFSIIEYLPRNNRVLNNREKYWIIQFDSKNQGFNYTKGGDGILGFKHTEETRKKISKNSTKHNKGKIFSKEIRKKMSRSHKGKIPYNKGISMKESQKVKISNTKKGIPVHTEEEKNIRSKHWMGNKNPNYREDINDSIIIELYEKKYSLRKIAKEFKCTHKTISNRLKKCNKI